MELLIRAIRVNLFKCDREMRQGESNSQAKPNEFEKRFALRKYWKISKRLFTEHTCMK